MSRRNESPGDEQPHKRKRPNLRPRASEGASASAAPRIQAPQPQAPSQRQGNSRHPVLWFPDGLLIVVASDGMRFKLHSGILSYHSEIIKGRLAALSPLSTLPSSSVSSAGVSQEVVLHLPEKGDLLGKFFSMIYNGHDQFSYFDLHRCIQFEDFYWILRLAIDFKVKHIVDAGFSRLELLFSSNFDEWATSDKSFGNIDKKGRPIEMADRDTVGVVALVRAAKRTSMLPVALYACSTEADATDIFDGIIVGTEIVSLDAGDRDVCVDARSRIHEIENGTEDIFLRGAFNGLSKNCTSRQSCLAACRRLVLDGSRDMVFRDECPFSRWDIWINREEGKSKKEKLCSRCKEYLNQEIGKHLQKGWEKLGEIFEVQGWSPSRSEGVEE
ncbi:hypothetical protein BDY19DRAFT_932771 [Irpex rosettiformis]|uniref:Uncharacterized protein n=1 Tax=Irpex rosettiformis TaxID=378272 RepID=A0ACB8U9B2_9APHY|nr:hypothetical protein BDY19DRAFT_932771 [Irpex rosettiformis]